MQASKLFRRGRRIKEVEAVYGKSASPEAKPEPAFSFMLPQHADTPPGSRTSIPQLKPQFFNSTFFQRFQLQRPIIDPQEFSTRYMEQYSQNNNDEILSPAGHLISMLLVIWAAAFGIDEAGVEKDPQETLSSRKARCNEMITEVLSLIDAYGVLRKPSWDGVRALLLLEPLTADVLSSMDRLVMHESTMSQVCTLCSLSSVDGGTSVYAEALVRGRIFWYAHTQEGLTTGLEGGRLILAEDDLELFLCTIPPPEQGVPYAKTAFQYHFAYQLARIPLRISACCRQIHASFIKSRKGDQLNEVNLRMAGDSLQKCWFDLDRFGETNDSKVLPQEDCDHFVSLWQIAIFQCCNVMRERVKQLISESSEHRSHAYGGFTNILTTTENKCRALLPLIISIIRRLRQSSFFAYDAALVGPGVNYAAQLVAQANGSQSDLQICHDALSQMRWPYSKYRDALPSLTTVRSQQQGRSTPMPSTSTTPWKDTSLKPFDTGIPQVSSTTYFPLVEGAGSSSMLSRYDQPRHWMEEASSYLSGTQSFYPSGSTHYPPNAYNDHLPMLPSGMASPDPYAGHRLSTNRGINEPNQTSRTFPPSAMYISSPTRNTPQHSEGYNLGSSVQNRLSPPWPKYEPYNVPQFYLTA